MNVDEKMIIIKDVPKTNQINSIKYSSCDEKYYVNYHGNKIYKYKKSDVEFALNKSRLSLKHKVFFFNDDPIENIKKIYLYTN